MFAEVKTLTAKGFGFLKTEVEGAKDLFFHATALQDVKFDELKVGDKVEYEEMDSEKGLKAVDVRLVQ